MNYRFQIQGPNAQKLIQKAQRRPVPDIKFFNMDTINDCGSTGSALRHGMAGHPDWRSGDRRKKAKRYESYHRGREGIRHSGWYESLFDQRPRVGMDSFTLPAVYTGEKMKPYRQWLPANDYGNASLAGSLTRITSKTIT